jgi:hypothetical protein
MKAACAASRTGASDARFLAVAWSCAVNGTSVFEQPEKISNVGGREPKLPADPQAAQSAARGGAADGGLVHLDQFGDFGGVHVERLDPFSEHFARYAPILVCVYYTE